MIKIFIVSYHNLKLPDKIFKNDMKKELRCSVKQKKKKVNVYFYHEDIYKQCRRPCDFINTYDLGAYGAASLFLLLATSRVELRSMFTFFTLIFLITTPQNSYALYGKLSTEIEFCAEAAHENAKSKTAVPSCHGRR